MLGGVNGLSIFIPSVEAFPSSTEDEPPTKNRFVIRDRAISPIAKPIVSFVRKSAALLDPRTELNWPPKPAIPEIISPLPGCNSTTKVSNTEINIVININSVNIFLFHFLFRTSKLNNIIISIKKFLLIF